jgi:hypothetical protein
MSACEGKTDVDYFGGGSIWRSVAEGGRELIRGLIAGVGRTTLRVK